MFCPTAITLHRYQSSPYGSTTQSVNGHQPRIALPVREAVEQQVVRVMKALLLGSPGETHWDCLLVPWLHGGGGRALVTGRTH